MSIDMTSKNSSFDKTLNISSLSSADCFTSNTDYSLDFHSHSSFYPTDNIDNLEASATNYATTNSAYNSTSGYGLIDAAAAVARAIGKNTFSDVPDLGGNNWGADFVKAPEVWAKGYTGEGVVVAVVDTGVDRNHNDLQKNIWTNAKDIAGNGKDDDGNGYIDDTYGWNFDADNNDTLDKASHGTHVSGTIAGVNNNVGVTGIAYNAKIMPVKVLNDEGRGSYTSIANGIYYAVNNGADVINLSLSGDSSNPILELAVEYASRQGVIVVMAAGNESEAEPRYPAHYAEKLGIAVGAVDTNNNMANFSNKAGTNPLTYVTAPGVDIYSTIPNNSYTSYSGTSMATPHVAGVVALMLSANKNLTDSQVRQIIAETAENSTQAATLSLDSNFATESSYASSSFNLVEYQHGFEGATQIASSPSSETIWTDNIPNEISIKPVLKSQSLNYLNTFNYVNYNTSGNDNKRLETGFLQETRFLY